MQILFLFCKLGIPGKKPILQFKKCSGDFDIRKEMQKTKRQITNKQT
jgi:hypothetical protein